MRACLRGRQVARISRHVTRRNRSIAEVFRTDSAASAILASDSVATSGSETRAVMPLCLVVTPHSKDSGLDNSVAAPFAAPSSPSAQPIKDPPAIGNTLPSTDQLRAVHSATASTRNCVDMTKTDADANGMDAEEHSRLAWKSSSFSRNADTTIPPKTTIEERIQRIFMRIPGVRHIIAQVLCAFLCRMGSHLCPSRSDLVLMR